MTNAYMDFAMESRALVEAAFTLGALPFIPNWVNRGDGHTVIVFPGFGAGPESTYVLRSILNRVGYDARDWGQGRNVGPSDELEEAMLNQVVRAFADSGDQVSLVGWSLGGLYARALANDNPMFVRQVITLGSPHKICPEHSAVKELFEKFSPKKIKDLTDADYDRIRRTPDVPTASIYTRSDGIVNWFDCLNEPRRGVENIEVSGSHFGLTHNLEAILHIVERLQRY